MFSNICTYFFLFSIYSTFFRDLTDSEFSYKAEFSWTVTVIICY